MVGAGDAARRRLDRWAVATVEGNADIENLVEDLPASIRALIGSTADVPLSSAAGYLQARLFSSLLPIVLLVYAVGLGARAIGGAEEDGTLQLVVTAPVSRRRVALERLAGSVVLVVGLAVVGLATVVALGAVVGLLEHLRLTTVLIATGAVVSLALLHLAIAFSVGAAGGRRGPAVAVAASVAVAGYVLHGRAASAMSLQWVRVASPWWWLLDRNLLVEPPTFLSLLVPLVAAVVIATVGLVRFERRDLRFP